MDFTPLQMLERAKAGPHPRLHSFCPSSSPTPVGLIPASAGIPEAVTGASPCPPVFFDSRPTRLSQSPLCVSLGLWGAGDRIHPQGAVDAE